MSSAGMDIVIKAIDNASPVLKNIEGAGTSAGKTLSVNWKGVSVAVGGVALGLEKLARTQAPLTEATRNLSASTGISEGKMRDLVRSTSDVSFSLEDTIATMQTGREQGLKSAKDLKKYALSWDQVAKATGGLAPELAKTGVALNAIGIEAGQEGKATNAFGFIIRDTSQTIDDFLGFVGKTGSQLRSMGMDVDDTAAIFGALEQGLGLTGRIAKSKFTTAVDATNKSLEKMADDLGLTSETARSQFIKANTDSGKSLKQILDTLGLTTQQFEEYKKKVAESGNVVKEQAANNDKSFTWMQKLQQAAKELTYKYGDLIAMFGNLSPILAGIVPAGKLVWKAFEWMPKGAHEAVILGGRIKSVTGLIKDQGVKSTVMASIQNSKMLPAFKKTTTQVGKMAKSMGAKAVSGFKSIIGGIGDISLSTAASVLGVAGAIAALALAIYEVIKAHAEFQKACVQEAGAVENEEAALKNLYNLKGKAGITKYLEENESTMSSGTFHKLRDYGIELIKAGPPDKSKVGTAPLAKGGIVTRPTFALLGENYKPEAVIPLDKMGGMGFGGARGVKHEHNHSGTMTVKVVNGEDQLKAVIPIVIAQLRREVRGGL